MRRWKWIAVAWLSMLGATAFGQFRYDLAVITSRDGTNLEVQLTPTGPGLNATLSVNTMELFFQAGTQQQVRRASDFYFELDWPNFPNTPRTMIAMAVDLSQLGTNQQNRVITGVTAQGANRRIAQIQMRVRALRTDDSGRPTIQQGNVIIDIVEYRDGSQPDRVSITYYEGSSLDNATYRFDYAAIVSQGELFAHRRAVR